MNNLPQWAEIGPIVRPVLRKAYPSIISLISEKGWPKKVKLCKPLKAKARRNEPALLAASREIDYASIFSNGWFKNSKGERDNRENDLKPILPASRLPMLWEFP